MKAPRLKYVKFTRAKGTLYAYFNSGRKVAGKVVWLPLPAFGTTGFYDTYASYMGARSKRQAVAGTVSALADQWERSEGFNKLAAKSQKSYSTTLNKVREQLGKFSIEQVERRHIREIVNNRIKGNASRNLFLAVVGAMYRYAREEELTDREPAKGIRRFKTGEHDPWDLDLLTAALEAEEDRVRLAVSLLYYTGQRIGDVTKMRWKQIRAGAITVKQEKTGKTLRVPLHADLQRELDATPKQGITILTGVNGRPVKPAAIRDELQAWALKQGHEIVPHGLRKNAVNALLEASCTIAEVAAITGQSFAVVEHYARKVDQNRLGDAAILKLEQTTKVQTKCQTTPETRRKLPI